MDSVQSIQWKILIQMVLMLVQCGCNQSINSRSTAVLALSSQQLAVVCHAASGISVLTHFHSFASGPHLWLSLLFCCSKGTLGQGIGNNKKGTVQGNVEMQSIREGSTITQFVAFQTIVCSPSPATIFHSLFDTAGLCS